MRKTVFCVLLSLSACSQREIVTRHQETMSRLTEGARDAFDSGDLKGALRLYRRALGEARKADDRRWVAECAYEAALCLVSLRRFREAVPLLIESEGEIEAQGGFPVKALLLRAAVVRRLGERGEAGRILGRIENALGSEPDPWARSQIRLLEARLACDARDFQSARKRLEEARNFFSDLDNPLLEAEAGDVEGCVLLGEGKAADAAAAFDRETETLKRADRYRRMAWAMVRAGKAWREAGKRSLAEDRLYRAARSLYAQGDSQAALRVIREMLPADENEAETEVLTAINQPRTGRFGIWLAYAYLR